MYSLSSVVAFVTLVSSVVSYSVHYNDCGYSYYIQGIDLDVECEEQPCYLIVNQPTNMTVWFLSSNVESTDFLPTIYLQVRGSSKALEFSPVKCPSGTCPVPVKQERSYRVQATAKMDTEPVRAELHWDIYNQARLPIICAFTSVILTRAEDLHKAQLLRQQLKNSN